MHQYCPDSSSSNRTHLSPVAGLETNRLARTRNGAFVISLDFELHWGVRDIVPLHEPQRAKLLAARAGIPHLLDLFGEFSVHATWATVGLLFARSREEAMFFRPKEQPRYRDGQLDPYLEQLGTNERSDPFHFAPSLIAEIAQREGQEIASHSFSHHYSMEGGQAEAEFEADLKSAVAIAEASGYALRSYIFPRNQVNPDYLAVLARAGFWSYRGTEVASAKQAGAFAEQRRPHKRAVRLLDSFIDIHGHQTSAWPAPSTLMSVPASRYLRPYHPVFRSLEPWLLQRIGKAMSHAAKQGEIFHLWWHPEDFAPNYGQNLRVLRQVLEMFARCRAEYGMTSLNMAEVCSEVSTPVAAGRCESARKSA